MDKNDIKEGVTYRANRPRKDLYGDCNDRTVIYIDKMRWELQYDGPAVAIGRHYPKISLDKFAKWAKGPVDITE